MLVFEEFESKLIIFEFLEFHFNWKSIVDPSNVTTVHVSYSLEALSHDQTIPLYLTNKLIDQIRKQVF